MTSSASVEVCDCGPGVPAEFREKIFERFWRGESSKEGAGLGLSIVRRIMNALKALYRSRMPPRVGRNLHCILRSQPKPYA